MNLTNQGESDEAAAVDDIFAAQIGFTENDDAQLVSGAELVITGGCGTLTD